MSVIAGIGYMYPDIGLTDLLHRSGVFRTGTVQHMLSGKNYDRAVQGLLLMDEALTKLFFYQFNKYALEIK